MSLLLLFSGVLAIPTPPAPVPIVVVQPAPSPVVVPLTPFPPRVILTGPAGPPTYAMGVAPRPDGTVLDRPPTILPVQRGIAQVSALFLAVETESVTVQAGAHTQVRDLRMTTATHAARVTGGACIEGHAVTGLVVQVAPVRAYDVQKLLHASTEADLLMFLFKELDEE